MQTAIKPNIIEAEQCVYSALSRYQLSAFKLYHLPQHAPVSK